MGTVTLFHSDGVVEESYEDDTPPSLKKMQEWVEGYVEHVTVLHNGTRAHMWVNEEGRICGRWADRNPTATEIYFAASRARGVDPDGVDTRHTEAESEVIRGITDRLAIAPINVITLPDDGKPEGIYGPAMLLEGFPEDVM